MDERGGREELRRKAGEVAAAGEGLVERALRGDLAREWLLLAAYVGDAVAREALGADAPEPVADLRDWLIGLEDWDYQAGLVAAIAVGRIAVDGPPPGPPPMSREAVAALEAHLAEPSAERSKAAREAWTAEAGWALDVDWSELAAELAWTLRWRGVPEADLREGVRGRVVGWVGSQQGKWEDEQGTST